VQTYTLIPAASYTGVIFHAEQPFFPPGTGWTYWTPTCRDITSAELCLGLYLAANAPQLAKKLIEYNRQYVGVLRDGRRLIYINCFPFDFGWWTRPEVVPDWWTKPVVVRDGGDRYFQVWYDVESGECSDLHINGEA
jgi:hypothetical protein